MNAFSVINNVVVFLGALCAMFLAAFNIYSFLRKTPFFVYCYYDFYAPGSDFPVLYLSAKLTEERAVTIVKIDVPGFDLAAPQRMLEANGRINNRAFKKDQLNVFVSPFKFNIPITLKTMTFSFCMKGKPFSGGKGSDRESSERIRPVKVIIYYLTASFFSFTRKVTLFPGDHNMILPSEEFADSLLKIKRFEKDGYQ